MKKIGVFILICFCCVLMACTGENNEEVRIQELNEVLITARTYANTTELAESVAPAIVGIVSADTTGESIGSGVCVASGGYVLTNSHVLANPNNITLHLANGSTSTASLVWQDTSQDIAVIKSQKTLPYLPFADSEDIKVAQDVVAVGTPISLLLKHSFTKGIISALDRTLLVDGLSGESYMQNLIQHDASLNPGNSGGPLINLEGEIVGINTLKINGGEGIGFAIPTKAIVSLLGNLVENINYKTPYLGAYGYDSEIANYYQLTAQKEGFYILDVAEGPIKDVGICKGCVITELNGEKIGNALDLRSVLYKLREGQEVNIKYIKNGNPYSCDVVLEEKSKY